MAEHRFIRIIKSRPVNKLAAQVILDRRGQPCEQRVIPERRRDVVPSVLVVDDNAAMHQTLRFILRGRCTLLSAENAEDALRIIEETPGIELVFLDIKLPGMSGLDALLIIKERWPAIPVTIVSESTEPGLEIRTIEMGAFHFMRKDFDFDWMNELLTTAMESIAAFRENERVLTALDIVTKERDALSERVMELESLLNMPAMAAAPIH